MGCGTKLAQTFMFIFNTIFFLFGLALLVGGIVLLVVPNSQILKLLSVAASSGSDADKQTIDNYFNSMPLVNISAIIFVAVGTFTFVVGFCGCCGAIRQSKCLLTTYSICLGFILIIEIAAAIVAVVFSSRVDTAVTTTLVKLQDKYFLSYNEFNNEGKTAGDQYTVLMNVLQVTLECCGIDKLNDVANSTSWKASGIDYKNQTMKTPLTCCALKDGSSTFMKNPNWSAFFKNPENYLADSTCPVTQTKSYTVSCKQKLFDYVKSYSVPIIGAGIGIGLIEIFGIVIACCLIKSREDDYYKN